MTVRKIIKSEILKDYFLSPPRCMLCSSEECNKGFPVCNECEQDYVNLIFEGCDNCGALPINCHCFSVNNCVSLYWLFNYRSDSSKRIINMLKKIRDNHTFKFLACRIVDNIIKTTNGIIPYDCVCYVPRNPKTKALYNHDHAEELAIIIAKLLGLPCRKLICHTGVKGEQKRLSKEFRGSAVLTRFKINNELLINGKLSYKAPLLVDDIVTTGSTGAECARLLKQYGAKLVSLAFIAHTPQGKFNSSNTIN